MRFRATFVALNHFVLSWPPASADPLGTKVQSPDFGPRELGFPSFGPADPVSCSRRVPSPRSRGEGRVRGAAIGRTTSPSPSSQPSPRERGEGARADPLGAPVAGSLVQGAAKRARRTLQSARTAGRAGACPSTSSGRGFRDAALPRGSSSHEGQSSRAVPKPHFGSYETLQLPSPRALRSAAGAPRKSAHSTALIRYWSKGMVRSARTSHVSLSQTPKPLVASPHGKRAARLVTSFWKTVCPPDQLVKKLSILPVIILVGSVVYPPPVMADFVSDNSLS